MSKGLQLSVTKIAKGPGVIVDNSVRMLTQCVSVVKKAESRLRFVRKWVENKMANVGTPSSSFIWDGVYTSGHVHTRFVFCKNISAGCVSVRLCIQLGKNVKCGE